MTHTFKSRNLRLGLASACISILFSLSASAQDLFDPVVTVNGDAVTKYELNQRIRFMKVLRQPGNSAVEARKSLIEDRLKMAAAERAGIRLSDEALATEMEEFAKRTGQTLPQFLSGLRREGVDQSTLRDFVEVGVTWREVIRSRFAGRGEPSAAEIDRALAAAGPRGGLRVNISEIILPARPGEEEAAERQAERLSQITSIGRFAAEARRLSASQSAANGGRLPAINVNELPAPLRPLIVALKPGETTAPLVVPNAVIVFQLRAIAETNVAPRKISAIEYAQVDGAIESVQLAQNQADTCDDLYGIVKNNPGLTLEIQSQQPNQFDQGTAIKLATLDPNESTIFGAGSGTSRMLMVCARVFEQGENISREEVTASLRTRRLNSLASGYLAELRASADIVNN